MSIIFTWKGVLFVFLFQVHELSKRLIVNSVKSNAKIIAKEQTALKLFIHFVFNKDTKDHYSEEGCKHRDIQTCCSSQNWDLFYQLCERRLCSNEGGWSQSLQCYHGRVLCKFSQELCQTLTLFPFSQGWRSDVHQNCPNFSRTDRSCSEFSSGAGI